MKVMWLMCICVELNFLLVIFCDKFVLFWYCVVYLIFGLKILKIVFIDKIFDILCDKNECVVMYCVYSVVRSVYWISVFF